MVKENFSQRSTYSKPMEHFHFDYNIPRTTLQWHKRDLDKTLQYITIEDINHIIPEKFFPKNLLLGKFLLSCLQIYAHIHINTNTRTHTNTYMPTRTHRQLLSRNFLHRTPAKTFQKCTVKRIKPGKLLQYFVTPKFRNGLS